MLLTVESIVEGTWGSGDPPPEFVDYFLMREMPGWSWEALERTPVYVKRYCYDFRQIELAQEADEQDRQKAQIEAQRRGM